MEDNNTKPIPDLSDIDESTPEPPKPDSVITPTGPESDVSSEESAAPADSPSEEPRAEEADTTPSTDTLPVDDPVAEIEESHSAAQEPETAIPSASASAATPAAKPKKSKKPLLIVIILLLIAAVAAYWWFFVRKDTKQAATPTTPAAAVKKDVALIRYGAGEGVMNQFFPTLNNDETTLFMNRQVFEGLVGFEDKTKIVPVLAESWQNPDNTTWVFTLKSGVKFHNGDTLTAKDVVYSWQQLAKNEDFADTVTSTIKDVTAVNDTHVKITTDGVDPVLLNRLTGLLIVDSKAAGKADPQFGTGPYTVKQGTTPDEANIDLAAFDNYHGGHVYTRELQIKVYQDAADKPGSAEQNMVADMKNGKLDLAGFVSGDRLAQAKQQGLQTFPVDDVSVYQLMFNVNKKDSPLANLKVRQAIYQAIDVDALMKAIGRTGTVADQFLPSYIPGYNSDISRPKLDVNAAKQAIKDAGYPNGLTFTLTAYTASQDAVTELARQLKAIGVTVKPDIKDDVAALQTGVGNGSFDAFYFAQGSSYGDASDVFAVNMGTPNYQNDKIDALLKEAGSTLDQTKRLNDLKQISKLGMDDVPIVPLYINQPNWVATQKYVMTQDMLSNDIGVYFYKVHTTN